VQIQGTSLVKAPRARVWALLNDPAVLARCTPGLESLEPDGEDRFKAAFTVKLGVVTVPFKGQIEVTDKVPEEAMTLSVTAGSAMGGANARGRIALGDEGADTRVTWSGEPRLVGLLASVGARLAEPVARAQAAQFFSRLEEEARRT
jgi:carbon monoxide dehydrogenase subunit G